MNWPTVKLGDVCEPVKTWNPTREKGEFRYVDIASINRETKQIESTPLIECENAPSRARQLIQTSDVVVSTVRPNLNAVALVTSADNRATASTGFTVLRANRQNLNSNYLFHFVKTANFVNALVERATGISYPAVSDKIVLQVEIPLPPLAEQQRIAARLDAADRLRALRRDAVAALDALTHSLFLEMFGDPMLNDKNWPTLELVDVCNLINGKAFKPTDWTDEGVPIIRIQNLNDSKKPFNYFKGDLPKKFFVHKGDILLSWSGTPGTSFGCFSWNGPEGWLNQHIFNVHLKLDWEKFFFIALVNAQLAELIAKAHGGVGLQHITKSALEQVKLMAPPLSLQREFAARLGQIEAVRSRMEDSRVRLDALFASLQSAAFEAG